MLFCSAVYASPNPSPSSSSTKPGVCSNLNYNYFKQASLGGPCMPDAKAKGGYANLAQCQLIYYCVLRKAYRHMIDSQHRVVDKPRDKHLPYHFVSSKNVSFASFDVGFKNSAAPMQCDAKSCTTSNLMWVTQEKQIKQNLCSNPLLKQQQSNSSFIGLYMHQLLGMPPLAANQSNTSTPYKNKGLYVFSFPKKAPSLNPDDSTLLDFEYQDLQGAPALVAPSGYSISNAVSSVVRLCKSGYQLTAAKCVNKFKSPGDAVGYNTWVKKWIDYVYPTNFLKSKKTTGATCQDGGKTVSCLEEYRFFPWTSMGATYNWSKFSAQHPRGSLVGGMYEYGIPAGVTIDRKYITFIPIEKMVATICTSDKPSLKAKSVKKQ